MTIWYALSHAIPDSSSESHCEQISSTYKQIITSIHLCDMPFAQLENKSKPTIEDLQPHIPADDMCLQLAIGHLENEAAKKAYNNMLSLAKLKDWNTCTDEEECPQLKKVSCAALACFLKHTGQQDIATESRSRPKKALVDVYRSVFALRKITFSNRPIKNSEEDEAYYNIAFKEFEDCCNLICSRLFFIMQLVNPVIADGGDRILPLTFSSGAKPKLTRSRRIGSPSVTSPKKPGFFRLASQPGLSSQSEYDFDTRSDSVDYPSVSYGS